MDSDVCTVMGQGSNKEIFTVRKEKGTRTEPWVTPPKVKEMSKARNRHCEGKAGDIRGSQPGSQESKVLQGEGDYLCQVLLTDQVK